MIAERIKELRERNGYTQSVLAKKLGITRSAVNAWEMGVNVPTAQYIIALSRIFKVSADYILNIDCRETVDITFLSEEEKAAIFSLLKCFDQYRGYDGIKEEFCRLKEENARLPDGLQEMLENAVGNEGS